MFTPSGTGHQTSFFGTDLLLLMLMEYPVSTHQNGLVGETYWIYFPTGMEDLPEQFDKSDACTVKFKVISKEG